MPTNMVSVLFGDYKYQHPYTCLVGITPGEKVSQSRLHGLTLKKRKLRGSGSPRASEKKFTKLRSDSILRHFYEYDFRCTGLSKG